MISATMMAGDSMRARAATMCPPWASPDASRKLVAAIKVTALTDP